MKVEEHNLREEIKEIILNALRFEVPNEGCAVFRIMRKEHYDPINCHLRWFCCCIFYVQIFLR